jgi:hypothetical protein
LIDGKPGSLERVSFLIHDNTRLYEYDFDEGYHVVARNEAGIFFGKWRCIGSEDEGFDSIDGQICM